MVLGEEMFPNSLTYEGFPLSDIFRKYDIPSVPAPAKQCSSPSHPTTLLPPVAAVTVHLVAHVRRSLVARHVARPQRRFILSSLFAAKYYATFSVEAAKKSVR